MGKYYMRRISSNISDVAYSTVDYSAQSGLIKGEIPLGEKFL